MSEQPTAPAPSGGGGKKIFGLPRNVVIIGAVTFLGALGYIIWKRSQAKAAATTTAAANTASTTANSNIDYSGELSVIQTELEALLAQQGTGGTTVTTAPPPPAGTPVSVAVPNGSGGWMNYTFPSQKALNDFYLSIGVTNGAYPNGLSSARILAALAAVGAYPQTGPTATPAPGTEAPPPASVGGLPSYGPY